MTLPASGNPISFLQIIGEVGLTGSNTLSFLNTYIKPGIRPGNPNFDSFHGLKYYLQNNAGNCINSNNNNCNCNCGNIQCYFTDNCTNVNCWNCDSQFWLQTGDCNVYPTPVYNCTSNGQCFSYNCNCSKIICTKLFEIGLMKQNIFEADQAFGEQLIKTNPDIYNGYRAWAEIVVDWMEGKGPNMLPWLGLRGQEITKQWAITWAYDIATPWAEEMAYMMDEKESGSLTGRMIMGFGIPICKVVGVWQRWIGPSKQKPGFIKGSALVSIFVMFKLVAELGRMIEKFIPNKKVA